LAADKNWLPLRWIEEPIPGKSHALNHALLVVESPVIAFVDDDHRVGAHYLWAVDSGTREYPNIRLFCGRIIPDWDGSEPDWVHDDGTYKIYPLPVPRFDQGDQRKVLHPGTATPGGGNLFMRRTLFTDVGKFEPKLGPVGHNLGGAEDIHWVRRAMSMGETLQYIPEAIQYHYVDHERLKLVYLAKKAYERSSSVVRLAQQSSEEKGIPRYVLRKILNYALASLISVSMKKRRFFLVRLAASAGELKGFIMRRSDQRKGVINGSA
jgi:GT2 family glycosyltransferase